MRGKWQKGADEETKWATEPTHRSFLLDQLKLAVKPKSQGCMFVLSYRDCQQSAASPEGLHPNAYLCSRGAVKAGTYKGFGASVGNP